MDIRDKLNRRMAKESSFFIKDFRHPVSGKHYSVRYFDGYMTVIRNAKSQEKKTFTCDSFLYFWLEDEDFPSQEFCF